MIVIEVHRILEQISHNIIAMGFDHMYLSNQTGQQREEG